MLVSLKQLMDHAAENSYGHPAFNVSNIEQIHAVMKAAKKNWISSSNTVFKKCKKICNRFFY